MRSGQVLKVLICFFGLLCALAVSESSAQEIIAQAQQVGPSIKELFEASRSFAGGSPQIINLEKQDLILVPEPGSTVNFFGGDCLAFLKGKLLMCTGSRTLEIKAREIYFELLSDNLAMFELDESGTLKVSILKGSGAVLSFSPQSAQADPDKKTLQIKEGQAFYFKDPHRSLGAGEIASSIRYSDPGMEIVEGKIEANWRENALLLIAKNSSAGKRLTALLKGKR
ncbi:MAG: hypothetical protein K2X77_31710 [Candidatus Obscuribacterales bacterium]|nr:hypothetical protein [Candidatus Obscuribacterales bacterium]